MPAGGRLAIDIANVVLDDAFVRSHAGGRAGRYVRLSVADTGQGMPPDVLAHVFEPFFTTKTLGKGTGLGLATRVRCGEAERRDRGRGIGGRTRHDGEGLPAGGRRITVPQLPSFVRRRSASNRGSDCRPSNAGATPRNSISPSRASSARSRLANARSLSPRPA